MASFLRPALSLRAGTDYERTIANVRADVELSASKIWSLTFAILIASVGLNVDSTAVIIGAMLVSPLMGPIVGMGLALGTDDVALIASTSHFFISPLADALSELLSRTKPTLYDVLIALFGGGAGIGAMHLFLINALFVCLSTRAFVRALRFTRVSDPQSPQNRRVHTAIALLTAALVVPSIYTGWNIVQETRFQRSARGFITERVRTPDRAVLSSDLQFDLDSSTITATVLGPLIPPDALDSLCNQLVRYGLQRARLVVLQPLQQPATLEALREQLRQSLSRDVTARAAASGAAASQQTQLLTVQLNAMRAAQFPTAQVFRELSSLEPALTSLGLGRRATRVDSLSGSEGAVMVLATWTKLPSTAVQQRVRAFLTSRLHTDSLTVTHVLTGPVRE